MVVTLAPVNRRTVGLVAYIAWAALAAVMDVAFLLWGEPLLGVGWLVVAALVVASLLRMRGKSRASPGEPPSSAEPDPG